MPAVLAHAGGNLFDTVVQLVVFLGPVPVIFYFLVRAMLDSDDEEGWDRGPHGAAADPMPVEDGPNPPATP